MRAALLVEIKQPARLGDCQPFSLHASDQAITVEYAALKPFPLDTLAVFEGDRQLVQFLDGGKTTTLPKLAPGVHALHLRGKTSEQQMLLSRPHTIIVK